MKFLFYFGLFVLALQAASADISEKFVLLFRIIYNYLFQIIGLDSPFQDATQPQQDALPPSKDDDEDVHPPPVEMAIASQEPQENHPPSENDTQVQEAMSPDEPKPLAEPPHASAEGHYHGEDEEVCYDDHVEGHMDEGGQVGVRRLGRKFDFVCFIWKKATF